MCLRLVLIFALLSGLARAAGIPALPLEIYDVELTGSNTKLPLIQQFPDPALGDGADIQQLIALRQRRADNAVVQANKNLKIVTDRKQANLEEISKLEPVLDAEKIAKLEQDNRDLDTAAEKIRKDILMAERERLAAMGQGARVSAGGSGGGGGGGGALLGAALIGAAVGAGVAMAASGGGGDQPPAQTSNDELAKAQLAAEQDFRNRMTLEGQLVELGEQRRNDFQAMDAQLLGVVAPTPYVPYAAPPVY